MKNIQSTSLLFNCLIQLMTQSHQYESFEVLTSHICTFLWASDVCRSAPSHEPQLSSITIIRVYRVPLFPRCLADLGSKRVAGKKNVKFALWTRLQRAQRVSLQEGEPRQGLWESVRLGWWTEAVGSGNKSRKLSDPGQSGACSPVLLHPGLPTLRDKPSLKVIISKTSGQLLVFVPPV